MVVVGTVVNRSVCLFGSVLCILVYFQFTSHLHVPPSLSLILNKDRSLDMKEFWNSSDHKCRCSQWSAAIDFITHHSMVGWN